jgi:hypothetical protein
MAASPRPANGSAVLDGKVGVIEGSIALARYVDAYYLSRYQVQKVGSDIQRPH